MNMHTAVSKWVSHFALFSFLSITVPTWAQVTPPIASVNGGRFTAPFSLSLTSATPNADLRYTLDGSVPDSLLSPQYTAPLAIDKTTTLRVKAFSTGQVSSTVTTNTYFFNVNHTFPIVALSFKSSDFFNDSTGIYTKYTNGLEVPVHVEFFETGSTTAAFSQLMGTEIQGSASASLPQKSLELKPKKAYGLDNIPYQMFSDLPYTSYKRLVLRNDGQDWGVSMFRDDLMSSLASKIEDLNGIIKKPELYMSAYRPAVVYFNGQFWGIYSIKERMKTPYVEQHFGLKGSGYDMIENEEEVLNGDSIAWRQLYLQLNSGENYADNATFEKLKSKINVQNFMDYKAFNIYIDNEDWPGNNVRRFKPRTADGKWTWISYDFDFAFGMFQVTGGFNTGDATPNTLKRLLEVTPAYFNNPYWSTLLFRKCMDNSVFRRDFINRTADMMNTVFKADRVTKRIDEFTTLYAPEIPNQTKKWGTPQPKLWPDNLNKMKNFANNRKANILKHIDEQFTEVTGNAEVTLNVSPAGAGSIQFSTLNVNTSGWTGTYFKGVDIPVKAIPAEGYSFVRWEGKTLPAVDSVGLNLIDNTVLTAVFTLKVDPCLVDTIKPTFKNCPTNMSLSTLNACALATWVEPTATDACTTTPIVNSNFTSGACFPLGTTTVTYIAFDSKNNISTCSFDITVTATTVDPCTTDAIQPTIQNCPSNIALSTTGSCEAATWTVPTATDNCGTPSVLSNFASGTCFPIGTTTVTYTATDAKNNTSTCSFNVTVTAKPIDPCTMDATQPTIQNCPSNIALSTIGSCEAATWTAPAATDNCGIASITSNFASGTCFPIGTTKIIYTAFDNKNNSSTCNFDVTVTAVPVDPCATDVTKPVFQNCPLNIVQSTSATCTNVNWVAPTATDNCGVPTITSSHNSGTCFPLGATIVTYTATDAKNNKGTCSFVVNVLDICTTDTVKPILQNCPSNISLTTSTACAAATWVAPTATDNCGTPSVISSHNIGYCFPIGNTAVTYTATDAKNNKSTCIFNVTVSATVVSCPRTKGSVIREMWTNVTGSSITNLTGNAAYLNKPTRTAVLTEFRIPAQEVDNNYGDRVRAFIYPPTTGNYTFHVYGDDNADLYLNKTTNLPSGKERIAYTTNWTNEYQITKQTTQKSATIRLDAGKEYYIELLHKESTGGDHFGVMWTLPNTTTAVVVSGQYLAQYDSCQTNNTNICATDTEVPVIQNCPANISLTTDANCLAATWTSPTATDNCTLASLSSNYNSGFCFPIGTTAVTYTATDAKLNKTTCTFNVTVIKQTTADIGLSITSNLPSYKRFTYISFIVKAVNNSNTAMTNVKINFPSPANTASGGTVVASTGKWSTYCGSALCNTWTIPTLAANSTATLTVPLFVLSPSGALTATATLQASTPTDNVTNNNQATMSVPLQSIFSLNLVAAPTKQQPTQRMPLVVQSISPNPTDEVIELQLESVIKDKVKFYISNTLGEIIKTESKDVEKGSNTIQFDVTSLQSGIYFIYPETNIAHNVPTKFVKM